MNVQQPAVFTMVAFRMFCICFLNVVAFESTGPNCDIQKVLAQQIGHFHCPICHEFMELSQIKISPSCYHLFCALCIDGWLSEKSTCPLCRQDLYGGDLFSLSTDCRDFLERTKVVCPYKHASRDNHDACKWEGSFASLKQHTETECLFSRLHCPNNCLRSAASVPELYSGAELPGHRKICPFEPVKCPNGCSDAFSIARQDLPDHMENSCTRRRMVKCLLCKEEMASSDLRQHLKTFPHVQPSSSLIPDSNSISQVCSKAKSYDIFVDMLLHSEASSIIPILRQGDTGETMLYRAASNGDADVVETLLHYDTSKQSEMVLITSIDGVSPLMASSKCGHQVAKLLLEANPSENHLLLTDRHGNSALSYAIINGNLKMVRLLLDANSLPRHLRTVRDSILLSAPLQAVKLYYMAARSSYVECLMQRYRDGSTFLSKLVLASSLPRITLLLECNSSDQHLLAANIRGWTPLMTATLSGQTQVVALLLKFNSNNKHLLAKDKFGETALMMATRTGRKEVVKVLLNFNSDEQHLLETDTSRLETALMMACGNGDEEVVELLLKHNSLNKHLLARNKYGKTALMLAIGNGHDQVVKLLLRYNFSKQHLLATDYKGRTAERIAEIWNRFEALKLLQKASSLYLVLQLFRMFKSANAQ